MVNGKMLYAALWNSGPWKLEKKGLFVNGGTLDNNAVLETI